MVVTEIAASPVVKLGMAGPVLVAVWRRPSDVEALSFLERIQTEVLKRFDTISTLSVITIVEAHAPAPGLKQKAAELQRRFDGRVVGSAIVITQTGIAATISRAFLTGLILFTRSKTPQKVCSDIGDGCRFLRGLPAQARMVVAMDDMESAVRGFVDAAER